MNLTLDLKPDLEARLKETAARAGMSLEQYLAAWLEQIPEPTTNTRGEGPEGVQDPELAKLIEETRGTAVVIAPVGDLGELLARWRAEDETTDEQELARRDAEWEDLKANLNANRSAAGERLLFPDDEHA